MKKLKQAEINRSNEYAEKLRELAGKIEDEINFIRETAFVNLNKLILDYNEVLGEANGFIEDLVNEMEQYADSRSEKWQDSDAGSEYADWKSNFENVDLESLDEFSPDTIDFGFTELSHADELEALPVEPG